MTIDALADVALPGGSIITIPLTDPAVIDSQVDHPLDGTGVRRALAAPRAGRPGAQRDLGRPGRRLSDMVAS